MKKLSTTQQRALILIGSGNVVSWRQPVPLERRSIYVYTETKSRNTILTQTVDSLRRRGLVIGGSRLMLDLRGNYDNALAILADNGYTKISSFFLDNELFIHCKKEIK